MPELPEVETIKNELLPQVVGRHFAQVNLLWKAALRRPSVAEFLQRLPGRGIEGLSRRGKYLLFHLSGGSSLILHFKMSGLLRLGSPGSDAVTAIFYLDDGQKLFFCDRRKFGSIWLVKDVNLVLGKLGPEPLSPSFTSELLRVTVSRRRVPIKVLLCDQSVIAGIGNMYADEALFAAGVHPMRRGDTLLEGEIQRLHQAIKEVLERGIKNKGASTDTYRRPGGERGIAHHGFKVAHRVGQPCPQCGTPIERIFLRGRGAYFCPLCQPTEPQPRLL